VAGGGSNKPLGPAVTDRDHGMGRLLATPTEAAAGLCAVSILTGDSRPICLCPDPDSVVADWGGRFSAL
jgi:hypothetical protein